MSVLRARRILRRAGRTLLRHIFDGSSQTVSREKVGAAVKRLLREENKLEKQNV